MDTGVLLGMAHNELRVDQLAQIAVGVIHDVHVPDTEILVGNFNHILIHVEGALVAGEVILAVAVVVFQEDVGAAVHHAQIAAAQSVFEFLGAAVEHQHVRVGDLFHHQLAHVFGIHLKGGGLYKGHDLIQNPVGRQDFAVQPLDLPHAVVFNQDLLGLVLLFQLLHVGAFQVLLVLNGDHGHIVQNLGVVFQFAFLAAQEQSPVPAGKAVLQDAVDEIGFAAVQKTGDQIDRNISHLFLASFPVLQAKQLGQLRLVQVCADDAQTAGVVGMTCADFVLFGNVVELDPAALAVHDALGAEDLTVFAGVQFLQNVVDAALGKGLGRFLAPGGEDLFGMMVVMVMAAAGAVGTVFVMVLMMMLVVVMIVMMLMLMVIVIMMVFMLVLVVVMIVAAALAIMIVVFMFMMMVVVVAGTVGILALVVMVLVLLVLGAHLFQQLVGQRNLFDGGEDHLAVQLVPGSGDDSGFGILLLQHMNSSFQLFLTQLLGAGEDDGAGGFDLVVIELAEVLHIDLDLGSVSHGDEAVQNHIVGLSGGFLNRNDHVGQFTHAGGFDQDAVGVELLLNVLQSLVEVTHQRTADATGRHFGNLHAGFLQEAAVDADLTELVFDQNQLFVGESLGQQLLDQCGFAGTQKAGNNINFRHSIMSFA